MPRFRNPVIMMVVAAQSVFGQYSPFSEFQAMTAVQLQTLQVKLTHVGAVDKPLKSVVFKPAGLIIDLAKFTPFFRPGTSYANDLVTPRSFDSSTNELQALLQNHLGGVPAVVAGGVAALPHVSFSMVQSGTPTKGYDALLSLSDSQLLIQALRNGLVNNRLGLVAINQFACESGSTGSTGAVTEVTASVTVTFTGIRLNRATGRYIANVSVRNNTASAMTGPISVILGFTGNVKVYNSSGAVCKLTPEGSDFVFLPLTNDQLAAAATVQFQLEFLNPNDEPIRPTVKVHRGAGSR